MPCFASSRGTMSKANHSAIQKGLTQTAVCIYLEQFKTEERCKQHKTRVSFSPKPFRYTSSAYIRTADRIYNRRPTQMPMSWNSLSLISEIQELARFFGCRLVARLFPVNTAVEDTKVAQEVVYSIIKNNLPVGRRIRHRCRTSWPTLHPEARWMHSGARWCSFWGAGTNDDDFLQIRRWAQTGYVRPWKILPWNSNMKFF